MNNTNQNVIYIVLFVTLSLFGCGHEDQTSSNQLTTINPLAYTDVAYSSSRDSVIVSTYSGRIAQRIKGQKEENLIAQLADEIYSLDYSEERDEIFAATLKSGILILNAKTGTIIKRLEIEKWSTSISLSDDENYLICTNVSGKNYIWNINKNYQLIELPSSLSNYYVKIMDNSGSIYFSGGGKVVSWNLERNLIEKEISVPGKLEDVDSMGNLLLISHNELSMFNVKNDSVDFIIKHPNWPYILASGDTAYIPPQMKITASRFTNNKIYSAGLDRSIRVWDKHNGILLNDLLGHKATIGSIEISSDKKQLVSVDLKGGIKFWNLE
jgi:WD40 repeat protein